MLLGIFDGVFEGDCRNQKQSGARRLQNSEWGTLVPSPAISSHHGRMFVVSGKDVSNIYAVNRCVWFRQKKWFDVMYASTSSGSNSIGVKRIKISR